MRFVTPTTPVSLRMICSAASRSEGESTCPRAEADAQCLMACSNGARHQTVTKCGADCYQAATSHIGSAPRLAEMCRLVCRFPFRHGAKNAPLASDQPPLIGRLLFGVHSPAEPTSDTACRWSIPHRLCSRVGRPFRSKAERSLLNLGGQNVTIGCACCARFFGTKIKEGGLTCASLSSAHFS